MRYLVASNAVQTLFKFKLGDCDYRCLRVNQMEIIIVTMRVATYTTEKCEMNLRRTQPSVCE